MNLPSFVTRYIEKQKYSKQYRQWCQEYQLKLAQLLQDNDLSEDDRAVLKDLKQQYSLLDRELNAIHKVEVEKVFKRMISDERITDKEHASFESMMNYFHLGLADVHFDQNVFNKYRSLSLLDENILPAIPNPEQTVRVLFEKGETLHFANKTAVLRKLKSVTTAIGYSGMSSSIRIMKGLRYRRGAYKIQRVKEDVLSAEDTGTFYLTSKNIGYIGIRKQFSFPYTKVRSLELRDTGLYIFKDGRENPFIVTMSDYEVPLAVASLIINKHE
jgi:hypothetical protein